MVFYAICFLALLAVVLLCIGLGFAVQRSVQNRKFRELLSVTELQSDTQAGELLSPGFDPGKLAAQAWLLALTQRLSMLLKQSGSNWTVHGLILGSAVSAGVGFLLGMQLPMENGRWTVSAIVAAVFFLIPYGIVARNRRKRIDTFEQQLPEALDFLARSMRAGHGLSVGLEILVQDSPEPLATEFRRVHRDLQLGASLEISLHKLAEQVPLVDVRFFVSSVLLQQETGGNLSEILSKLAYVIRERFRLKGTVKAASAHGRITGLVLVMMPLGVAVVLLLSSPEYLITFAADPLGKRLLEGALGAQFLGFLVIRRIVNIKV